MILNRAEFLLVDNPLRALIQERYELPALLGMSTKRDFSTALEIGCGNGNGTRLIRKYWGSGKITAVDLDERMIGRARKKRRDKLTEFMVMDASRLDFPDDSFDLIFDFGIIHHIPNWRDCILELKRVLKDDGELIIEEASIETFSGFPGVLWRMVLDHPYEEMFTHPEFAEYIEEAGFTITSKKRANFMGFVKHFALTAGINSINSTE